MSIEVPDQLALLQEEFSKMAMTPVDFSTGKFVFQRSLYPKELVKKAVNNNIASGEERLEVYNQQYWFRLFTLIQEIYPILSKELNLWTINQLSSDYLCQFPSEHYSLDNLVDRLYGFMQTSKKWNQKKWLQLVDLETWYEKAFRKENYPELNVAELDKVPMEKLLHSSLGFQPSLKLFQQNWNLVEALFPHKEQKSELNETERPEFFALLRMGQKFYKYELTHSQYVLLKELLNRTALSDAFEAILPKLDSREQSELAENLSNWFFNWSRLGFFVSVNSK